MSNESIKIIDTLATDVKLSDREINEIVEKIEEKYQDNDVCLDELLDSTTITGVSVSDTVKIYAILFKKIESDKVQRVRSKKDLVDLAIY